MEAIKPKQQDVIFSKQIDGYNLQATEDDVFISTPNGAVIYIPYHPFKADRYTLCYDGINCSKRKEYADHIYAELVDMDWVILKYKIDTIVNEDINAFPFK